MKILKTSVPFFVLALMLMTGLMISCSKKSGGAAGKKGSMSAKIGSESFDASLAVQATKTSGIFQVSGSDSKARQMNITILEYKGVGEYALGGSATAVNKGTGRWTKGLATEDTYITQVGLGSGTCKITQDDGKKVSGTYAFTAKNTKQEQVTVTEGKFEASY